MTITSDESMGNYPHFSRGNADRLNTTTMLPASSCIVLLIHHIDWRSVSSTGHCSSLDDQGQEKLRKKNYFTTTSIVHLMTSDIGDPEACRIYLLFHFGRCLAIIGLKSWVSVEGLSLLWLHSGQQPLPCTIVLCACISCSSHPLLLWEPCKG